MTKHALSLYKANTPKQKRKYARMLKVYKATSAKRFNIKKSLLKRYFDIAQSNNADKIKFDLMTNEILKIRGFKR